MNIEMLNGVGPKSALLLKKIGIFTVDDLLEYYPYRYNFINLINFFDIPENEVVYLKVKVAREAKVMYIKRNFNTLSFTAIVNDININVKIFNRGYLKQNIIVGKYLVLVGKYDKLRNTFIANDIRFDGVENKIEGIYHLTDGINNNFLYKTINKVLTDDYLIKDELPEYLNNKYKLIKKCDAINLIHNPKSQNDIDKAKVKLIYDEFFNYTFKINLLKINNKKELGIKHNFNKELINEFLSELPFKLTEDQLTTIHEVLSDLEKESRMNRLIMGDVGSGKTIVAAVGILANFYSGYQSTFMAPTEILANQHLDTITNLFKDLGLKISILTGSLTKKKKEVIYESVKNGEIDLLIGTHALINDNLSFKNLGLVITDEQHLFGVNQRNALQNKGKALKPDVLYLSATPIPRTYALTIYGDLDLSMIRTKPKMRLDIITKVKSEKEITDVLYKMLDEIKLGHQIFVVSPLIDNNETDLKSVYLLLEKLNLAFKSKVNIGVIHGKMKQKEKDEIMNNFHKGIIKILISTTVIEVGIDIPNATMMVIFNAERFGLATLHQLRGRVGRNDIQSYCYLISEKDNDRLKVMEESSDGFYISEKDFEQRGQGNLFGIEQSGELLFKIADIKRDSKILISASNDSKEFIINNMYKDYEYYKNLEKQTLFLD
ncbi:MAG: ATP-dependent DNA helicase RecG [Bacilli bacterium]